MGARNRQELLAAAKSSGYAIGCGCEGPTEVLAAWDLGRRVGPARASMSYSRM